MRALSSVTDHRPLDFRRRESPKGGGGRQTDACRGLGHRKKKKGQKKKPRRASRLQIRQSGAVRSACTGLGDDGQEPRASSPTMRGLGEPSGDGRPVGLLRWAGRADGEKFREPRVTPRPQGCFADRPSVVSRPRGKRNRTRPGGLLCWPDDGAFDFARGSYVTTRSPFSIASRSVFVSSAGRGGSVGQLAKQPSGEKQPHGR